MAEKNVIKTDKAPQAIGPYSQGIRTGSFIFIAGQLGLDPETGEIVPGGIEAETRRVLQNLSGVLEAAGSTLDQVVKTTVFPARYGRFRPDELCLCRVLFRKLPGPHNRAGRGPAERRCNRDRGDRPG
jgi:enamine deaminase RidA (YjgF/YER057c/UK114 family)